MNHSIVNCAQWEQKLNENVTSALEMSLVFKGVRPNWWHYLSLTLRVTKHDYILLCEKIILWEPNQYKKASAFLHALFFSNE